jgi:hypothetical protein
MRRSIAADFSALPRSSVRVVVTLDVRLPHDPGPWQTEPIAPGNYGGRLRALARAADFTVLIAPETRGILAGLTRDLARDGVRLLGSSADAVVLKELLDGMRKPPSGTGPGAIYVMRKREAAARRR